MEPCFFVQGDGGGIVSGNMEYETADSEFLKVGQKLADQHGAMAFVLQAGENFHMMQTKGVRGHRGSGAGTSRFILQIERPGGIGGKDIRGRNQKQILAAGRMEDGFRGRIVVGQNKFHLIFLAFRFRPQRGQGCHCILAFAGNGKKNVLIRAGFQGMRKKAGKITFPSAIRMGKSRAFHCGRIERDQPKYTDNSSVGIGEEVMAKDVVFREHGIRQRNAVFLTAEGGQGEDRGFLCFGKAGSLDDG